MFCLAVYVFAWETEREKTGKHCQAHLATTAEKVQSLILSSEGDDTLQLTHAETSKSRLLMTESGLWDQVVQPHRLLYSMRRCVHLLCFEVSSTELSPDKTNLSLQTKQWAEAAAQRGSADRQDVVSSRFWEPHSAVLLLLALLQFDGALRDGNIFQGALTCKQLEVIQHYARYEEVIEIKGHFKAAI